MCDATNEICGLTIDFTPCYSNDELRMKCRAFLWAADEINGKFKRVLEGAGIEYMSQILKNRLLPTSYLRTLTEAYGVEDDDDGDRLEYFCLVIDIYGASELEEKVSDIVLADSTGRILIKELRASLNRYMAEVLPDIKLKWKLEVSEERSV